VKYSRITLVGRRRAASQLFFFSYQLLGLSQ